MPPFAKNVCALAILLAIVRVWKLVAYGSKDGSKGVISDGAGSVNQDTESTHAGNNLEEIKNKYVHDNTNVPVEVGPCCVKANSQPMKNMVYETRPKFTNDSCIEDNTSSYSRRRHK